ncbi:hypothetical protein Mp_8g02650 [Marchantia polymorpha subsp. ruderalis]|nr:hypothetical protein Mp_8g02650 [Marchantia polymorpha subsp. ruderalis]
MEVMKPRGLCILVMVRTLIDACPDQINHAVGTDAKVIDIQPWRQPCPIKSDKRQRLSGARPKEQCGTSKQEDRKSGKYRAKEKDMRRTDGSLLKGIWERMGTVDRHKLQTESMMQEKCNSTDHVFSAPNRNSRKGIVIDHYLTYNCSMAGHVIFHLAAKKDNAEVLLHLLSNCPGANVSILTAHGSGMTPLHCAIRAESMETFDVLMSHGEVDVNAVLNFDSRPRLLCRDRSGSLRRGGLCQPASGHSDPHDGLHDFGFSSRSHPGRSPYLLHVLAVPRCQSWKADAVL